MDITSAINSIQDLWLAIGGIKAAPDTPTESMNVFPFAVTFEKSGNAKVDKPYHSAWSEEQGTIVSELHVTRANLPTAVSTAMSYRNAFLNKLRLDPALAATVMIITDIRWTFGRLEWGKEEHIGYVFEIDVTLELTA